MKIATGFKGKLSVILLFTVLTLSPTAVYADTPGNVSEQFICQCGCTLVLENCTHQECHSRSNMTDLINQKLDQGQSEAQITQFFVAQYGEQVLASPPKKGFNLTAWILPFAAMLFGGGVVYVALRKWVKKGSRLQTAAVDGSADGNEQYESRLEKELEDFSEKGFR